MILVTQIGARRHYAVPAALERAGLLAGLYTDVCMAAPWLRMMARFVPNEINIPGWRSLKGREPTGVPDRKITCLWAAPWKMGRFKDTGQQGGQYARFVAQNEAFGRDVVARGFGAARAVYAFNGAAVEIFEAARTKGLRCILDMTIAPLEVIERLLAEERHKFPHIELGAEASNPPEQLIARERREWELADLILCGSEYVIDSLAEVGVPRAKCRVLRWGYSGPSVETDRSQRNGPLNVLIAGTVELRKGVQYALQAAQILADPAYHFRFVGPSRTNARVFEKQLLDPISGTTYRIHGPVPRTEMTHEYQNADVLLHPSLAEGSANVCYEAMAHGLPVVATPNAGSAVTHGVDGFIIPIRDPKAIADALRTLRDNPSLRQAMSAAARQRAATLTLAEYERALVSALSPKSPGAAQQAE